MERNTREKFKYFPFYDELAGYEYDNVAKLLVCDCDGILTDGSSFYSKDGKVLKSYGSYDKEMMMWLCELGWKIVFFTSDRLGYDIHKKRSEDLKHELRLGDVRERIDYISEFAEANPNSHITYFGDSISDLEICMNENVKIFGFPHNAPLWIMDYLEKHGFEYKRLELSDKALDKHAIWCGLDGGHGAFGSLATRLISKYFKFE